MERPSTADFREALSRLLVHVCGSKKNDCAIVIPSGTSIKLLQEHLSILARQDSSEFDVLIIGQAPSHAPKNPNVLIYNEKYPLGSSGAFGMGQALAYSLGYSCVINADLDCFPISQNLVRRLTEMAETHKKAILPRSVFDKNYPLDENRKFHVVNHYGAFPRALLEKIGFMHFRFFKGGEDAELDGRLAIENVLIFDDSVQVEHKNIESNYIDAMLVRSSKFIYYNKNFIIANILLASYSLRKLKPLHAARHFSLALFALANYWLMYNCQPDMLLPVFKDGLLLNFNARYAGRAGGLKEIEKTNAEKPLCICIEGEECAAECMRFKPKAWLVKSKKSAVIPYLFSSLLQVLAKMPHHLKPSAAFFDQYKFFVHYLMLLSPMEYKDNKIYSSGMGPLRTAIASLAFACLLPLLLPIMLLGIARGAFMQGYPTTLKNMEKNILEFEKYVEKMHSHSQ